MTQPSSYLAHLPPALWSGTDLSPGGDAAARATSPLDLGAVLRIFEKIATGIPDDVVLTHRRPDAAGADAVHEHRALTEEIGDLHQLFDPWTTPAAFLPWLASWVALDFPTLQDEPLWEEYQRRKVTAGIAQIYRLRGRRAGLNQYLELYAVGHTRPRVTVDDGARLVAVTPRAGAPADVAALVTQGPVVVGNALRAEGLTRPWSIAVDAAGNLLVGDIGLPDSAAVTVPSRLWQLGPSGSYPLTGTPPRPRPLVPELALKDVVGVAVRPPRPPAPETLYLLTRTGRLFAVPAPLEQSPATLVTTVTAAPGAAVSMVGLAVDPRSGDLLALDRGAREPEAAAPSLVRVQPAPLQVTRTALTNVREPLCLAVEPDGTFLIGDGREQAPATPAQFPGNLVRVDPRQHPWSESLLLPADRAVNPLVSPTAVVRLGGAMYVLDVGLKPFAPSNTDPFICPVAEHAAVYQVGADGGAGVVALTGPGQFVYPSGMVAAGDRLVVCDPGQREVAGLEPYWGRVRPFQFDVVVHFTDSRLPRDPQARKRALDQAVGTISTIVTEQKPGHTVWTLTTSIL